MPLYIELNKYINKQAIKLAIGRVIHTNKKIQLLLHFNTLATLGLTDKKTPIKNPLLE